MLLYLFSGIEQYFFQYLLDSLPGCKKPVSFFKKILIASSKLVFLTDYFDQVIVYPKDDLMSVPVEDRKQSPLWKDLEGIYEEVMIKDEKELK